MSDLKTARLIALAVPLGLMAGALGSQYWGGLSPCEMCMWQRYGHYAAIPLAALAFIVPGLGLRRALVALAALAILSSAAVGGWHAGVEWKWWPGPAHCTSMGVVSSGNILDDIMATPLVMCDEAQWRLFGISLAGYNFLISAAAGLFALARLVRNRP